MAGAGQGAELPAYDAGLFEHLRGLRRELAAAANLPPYIIFSDRALIEMAAYLPRSPMEFATIDGISSAQVGNLWPAVYGGDRHLCRGARFAAAAATGRAIGCAGPRIAPTPGRQARADEVGDLYAQGRSLAELQSLYNVKRSTIVNHLRDYQQGDGAVDAARLRSECGLPPEAQERVFSAFAELGSERLAPVYEALAGGVGCRRPAPPASCLAGAGDVTRSVN